MESKSPISSKTLWVNGLSIAAVVITALTSHELIVEHPAVMSGLTVALSAINMGLRFLTNSPLKAK